MSPPNLSTQPHEVHDAPREDELEKPTVQPPEAVTAGAGAEEEEDGTGHKDVDPPEKASDDAGYAVNTHHEGQPELKVEEGTHGTDNKDEVRPQRIGAASKEGSAGVGPDPEGQIASGTEAIDLSSTPPRETSSIAHGKAPVRSPSPPPPPPKDDRYLLSHSDVPSRTTSPVSQEKSSGRNSEDAGSAEYAGEYGNREDAMGDSGSEIQSIMGQFEQGEGGLKADEIMSPRMELSSPILESPVSHPPRRSSLTPFDKPLPTPSDDTPSEQTLQSPPPRTSSLYRVGTNPPAAESPSSSAHQPTPSVPQPELEPDLPFDFHRFLEQLRHRTADPVAKFLRSFLLEFGKKQWMVHEQVKIIGDFLEFISKKMAQCEIWRTVSDAEFDNAREGMEKLVMNRLYTQTFSPAIPPPEPVSKSRRRAGEPPGPGRRGQHQEDVERDEVLVQKVRIYKWVREEHLDIKPVGEKGKKFLQLAQQELLKIKSYRAPRDKVICILNCCKVIFGFLRTSQSDQSADAFVPLLIYTVLQANLDHLVSNVQYILRFRNQDKLGGEAGYYISSLMAAVQFVEGLDRTSLTVTDAEFEKNVEAAVSAIAEKHPEAGPASPGLPSSGMPSPGLPETSDSQRSRLLANPPHPPGHRRMPSPHLHLTEKSTLSRPEVTTKNSFDAEQAGPRRSTSLRTGRTDSDQPEEENAAVAGLLRTIQKPLSTIGRMFSDNDTHTSQPHPTPQTSNASRLTPQLPPRRSSDNEKAGPRRSADEQSYRKQISAEDAAARQASAEAEEARRIQRREHVVVVETLAGMFPGLDREVIDDVVRMKEGRYVHPFHFLMNGVLMCGLGPDLRSMRVWR
jgi:hypothetical protein